jgi:hypothetical protein
LWDIYCEYFESRFLQHSVSARDVSKTAARVRMRSCAGAAFAFVCVKLFFCLDTSTNKYTSSASRFGIFIPRKELLVSTGEENWWFPDPAHSYLRKKKYHVPFENQNNVNKPLALPCTE